MFTHFFYTLRKKKVPVTITEWMTLMKALDNGYIGNLTDFYYLARAILVKSESYFDHYDIAFQECFQGLEGSAEIEDKILEWLSNPLNDVLNDLKLQEGSDLYDGLGLSELIEEMKKRMEEQDEQHDGGDKWIGRGGRSPFGHSGVNPMGIRIGGESKGRGAIQIAAERRFKNYRSDLTLDIRQIKLALKGLRQLLRTGPEDELDLDETIQATANNLGDIELIWRRSRKNAIKVLLLMDVGGSMDPFAQTCSLLFSAANSSSHFRDFQYYYFHNCIYDNMYKNIERFDGISTAHLLEVIDSDTKLIVVGDARMGTWELTEKYGAIDYYERNEKPGIYWLKSFAHHFSHRVWLNPDDERVWIHPTVRAIGQLFPMYPLTIDGLNQAVKKLIVKR
jgi:uncharacterized protein with von Willebrand factor type A (vWA) domain